MRVMLINKADADSEAGLLPTQALLAAMGALIEEMHQNGILLAAEGLRASSLGVRLVHRNGKRSVTDGPFSETKELIGGFCIIKVDSMDDAIGWAQRMLDIVDRDIEGDFNVEIRPLFENDDFGDEFTPELRAAEDRVRAEIAQKQ